MSMFSGGELARHYGRLGCITIVFLMALGALLLEAARWVFNHVSIGVHP